MSYLSRLTLKRNPSAQALKALLSPADEGRRLDAHHRLIWTAFAGDPEAKRDFLWRDEGEGRFLVLSSQPPKSAELFEDPQVREFSPKLRAGDRLAFLLRANATRTAKTERITASGKREREHRDVVMELLKPVSRGRERIDARPEFAAQAGSAWIERQGAKAGFEVRNAAVLGYRVYHLPGHRDRNPRFGILDLEGVLQVRDPALFLQKLKLGFGRAKAFGCGLMLIRRA